MLSRDVNQEALCRVREATDNCEPATSEDSALYSPLFFFGLAVLRNLAFFATLDNRSFGDRPDRIYPAIWDERVERNFGKLLGESYLLQIPK